jgi:serine/threonine protein phosphatase 1
MFNWLKSRALRQPVYPPAPNGVVIYAIGDIHGRSDCLAMAHQLIDKDAARRGNRDRVIEIYVGDYVDRGPDTKGVIDSLIERSQRNETVLLRGNHETLMQSFLREQTSFEEWRNLGGRETILSYGGEARISLVSAGTITPDSFAKCLPRSHVEFLHRLENYKIVGRYCFVHAGLRPGVPVNRQSVQDLTWIREDFLNYSGDFGFVVVHGHSPVPSIELLPNRVNIDTGAYVTNRLSVVRIDAEGLSPLGDER